MKVLLVLLIQCALYICGETAGAGRAFPMDSENFAIKLFQGINPSITWDRTNFLIDLSGQFANCDNARNKGEMKADRKTPEGDDITILIDTMQGKLSDVDNVNQYVTELLKRWESGGQYHSQIKNNKRVGCSVRPACDDLAVVACVFSTGDGKGSGGDGSGRDGTGGWADGAGNRGGIGGDGRGGAGGLGDGSGGNGSGGAGGDGRGGAGDGRGGAGDGRGGGADGWSGGAGDGQYQ